MTPDITYGFDPFLPYSVIAGFIIASCFFIYFAFKQSLWVRLCTVILLALCILNPVQLDRVTKPVNDVIAVIVDKSDSQFITPRPSQVTQTTNHILENLKKDTSLDVRIAEIDGTEETRIFSKLADLFADTPKARRAGTIIISDGQVHDIPSTITTDEFGQLHVFLTGQKNEKDRRLIPISTPAFGIVGKTITIKLRLEDTSLNTQSSIPLTVDDGTGESYPIRITPGKDISVTASIEHAGENIITFSVPVLDDEISRSNNTLAITVKGVRDRLKVLLVSGEPHAGGRLWRDMLRADPAVDLVHFTILRNPDSFDATPRDELALIPFPFQELFEEKLPEFDLIIFDRYRKNEIMPALYYANIADYVRKGGAMLEVSGPSYAGNESIYATPLADILPGAPSGKRIITPFTPVMTPDGLLHPVLTPFIDQQKNWGPWLHAVELKDIEGKVLLRAGENGPPLLILRKIGEGRVAQLASDEVWLWSRGYKGGGPAADLFRRVAHWLMKEPALEEQTLSITAKDKQVIIEQKALPDNKPDVILTRPDGQTENLGALEDRITRPALEPGVYSITDGVNTRAVVVGLSDSLEYRNLLSTDENLKPAVTQSGGTIRRIDGNSEPDIRRITGRRQIYGGSSWIGLRSSGSTATVDIRQTPLIPAWAWLVGLLSIFALMWWREGGQKR